MGLFQILIDDTGILFLLDAKNLSLAALVVDTVLLRSSAVDVVTC
jgi:hypothetical protein